MAWFPDEQQAGPARGQVWRMRTQGAPWDSPMEVKVLDVADGWVKYLVGSTEVVSEVAAFEAVYRYPAAEKKGV